MKRFHSFRLDTINQCLWREDQRVSLTPKAFDVLRYLMEHSERLVTQDEILEAIWSETYVNPEVIKKYVLEIRKALGDSADKPLFVETFPKRGYRFIAQFRDEDVAADSLERLAKNIVGRRTAFANLETSLNRALHGQRQVIFITGEAGIGKTTLVDFFRYRVVHKSNLRIARGQCIEGFGGKEPYYPVLEALGHLLGDASVLRTLAHRAPTWLAQFPSHIRPEQRDALHREILGSTRERMVREVCEVLEAITSETPLVLILEDLHWVDPSTLDLISALARRRESAKLMLLCTYRPADVVLSHSQLKVLKQDLLVHKLCGEIALERLEETEIAEFLANEFGEALPAELARVVYRQSGGNALFMVAVVDDMRKQGVIAQDRTQGGWELTVPVQKIALSVPETLQDLLQTQVDRLSPTEQSILRSASVAGERFSVWTITPTLETEADQVELTCDELAQRQQVLKHAGIDELENGDASAQYEFRHSLYRQVLYLRLSDVQRSRLHRIVAERLENRYGSGRPEMASEMATHFEQGRQYERAIEYLLLTAENANRRFAYRDSIGMLQHALALAAKVPSNARIKAEVRILERIGDAQYALGNMLDSAEAYQRAASRASDAGLKAAKIDALNCLACTTVLIDGDRGIALSQQATEACQGLEDPLLNARTQLLSATLRLAYDQWRTEDAAACVSAHQTIGRLSDPTRPSYHQIWYAHLQSLQGEYQEALNTAEAGIPKFNEPTVLVTYVLALSAKAIALLHLGRFGEALATLRTAQATGEKNDSTPWIFIFREAWLRTLVFDFEGVRGLCDMVMSANPAYLSGQPKAMTLIATGYVALAKGDRDEAMRCFREVRDREMAPKFFLHWYWRMRAELGLSDVLLEAGEIVAAERETDRFLRSALSTADPNLQALAWDIKTRLAIAHNDLKSGNEFLQNALAILADFRVPVSAWRVHSTAWEFYARNGNHEAAEAYRAEAEIGILAIANSFPHDEPLRDIFLASDPVRKVLDAKPLKKAIINAAVNT